ncbi:hypothetical protein LTR62_002790 [Meristemomyces frigidus]|uniref:BTB domain-containing protein n=1 Tax=Meristemomyces frigidus TaxID=1508187 RepID=A0AAN7TI59_9PEZI|nr:hypothetical protein LTR62_002790 [Meristemomyces frigidus]
MSTLTDSKPTTKGRIKRKTEAMDPSDSAEREKKRLHGSNTLPNGRTEPQTVTRSTPPSTSERVPRISSFDTITRITVDAGREGTKTLELHKGLISFYSTYFDRALNGSFKEAASGVVKPILGGIRTFEIFQYWLYRQCLPPDLGRRGNGETAWDDFTMLWVFGDVHIFPLLQNATLDALKRSMAEKWVVPIPHVESVYTLTAPGSVLRRFYIDTISLTMEMGKHHYRDQRNVAQGSRGRPGSEGVESTSREVVQGGRCFLQEYRGAEVRGR